MKEQIKRMCNICLLGKLIVLHGHMSSKGPGDVTVSSNRVGEGREKDGTASSPHSSFVL